MTSPLSDALVKNQQGQLYKSSPEELQTLASQAGRQAAPTSPLEAGVLGANPNQAKMAGTGANKGSALRDALQDQTLSQAQKQQAQQAATTTVNPEQQKIQGLQGLTSLESRVDDIKNRAIAQATTNVSLPAAGIKLKAGTDPALAAPLQTLLANPADQAAWVAVNKQLGRQDGNYLTAQQLMDTYIDQTGSIPSTGIKEPSMKDLSPTDLQSMGYQSLADIEKVVGRPVADMTFTDFQNLVHEQLTQETGKPLDIQARLNDPTLGPAERAQLEQQLQSSGFTGDAGNQATAAKLVQDIQQAGMVTFQGQQMPIEQALSADNVTKWIQDYVAATPAEQETMKQQEPGLTGFVEKYKGLMTNLTYSLAGGEQKFQTTQDNNKKLATIGPGITASDDLMSKLVPGWGSATATPTAAPALLTSLQQQNVPPEQKQSVIGLLEQFKDNPTILKTLSTTPLPKLQQLGLADSTSQGYKDFTTRVVPAYSMITQLNPDHPDPQSVAMILGFKSPQDVIDSYNHANLLASSGLFGSSPGLTKMSSLVQGGTFSAQTWADIARKLKIGAPTSASIDNLAKGLNGQDWMKIPGMAGDMSKYETSAHDATFGKYLDDGKIDAGEAKDIGSTLTTTPDPAKFNAFTTSAMYKNLPSDVKQQFVQGAVDVANKQAETVIGGSLQDALQHLQSAPAGTDFSTLSNQIKQLQTQSSKANNIASKTLMGTANALSIGLADYLKRTRVVTPQAGIATQKTTPGTEIGGPSVGQAISASVGDDTPLNADLLKNKRPNLVSTNDKDLF